MKFLEAIEHKLMMLEQGDTPPDAAMPQDPGATSPPAPTTPVVQQNDTSGDVMQEQVSQNIKLCADAINALVVFVRGKFADAISATPGLEDQFRKLEEVSTVTDVSSAQLPLLKNIVTLITSIKSV